MGEIVGKVRGAFETVHGVGDSLRAHSMDALDNVLGTPHKSEDHAKLAEKGRQEAERGMARLRGQSGGGARGAASGASQGGRNTNNNEPNTDNAQAGAVVAGSDYDRRPGTTDHGAESVTSDNESHEQGMRKGTGNGGMDTRVWDERGRSADPRAGRVVGSGSRNPETEKEREKTDCCGSGGRNGTVTDNRNVDNEKTGSATYDNGVKGPMGDSKDFENRHVGAVGDSKDRQGSDFQSRVQDVGSTSSATYSPNTMESQPRSELPSQDQEA